MVKVIVLGIAALGLIFGAVVVARLVGWFGETEFGQYKAEAARYVEVTNGDDAMCLEKALDDLAACSQIDVGCQMSSYFFFEECAKLANYSPELCVDVPEDLLSLGLWTVDACPRADVNAEVCTRIMQQVGAACFAVRDQAE